RLPMRCAGPRPCFHIATRIAPWRWPNEHCEANRSTTGFTSSSSRSTRRGATANARVPTSPASRVATATSSRSNRPRRSRDRATVAQIETERGRISAIEGRYGAAEASFRRSRRLAEAIGDTKEAGWARAMVALVHADRCEYASAEEELRAALPALGWAPEVM